MKSILYKLAKWLKLKTCPHTNKTEIFICYQDAYIHEKCDECGLDIYTGLYNS